MPSVEVFDGKEAIQPLFVGEFDFMPRVGEYVSRIIGEDVGGYFAYYHVVEAWHRQDGEGTQFRACILVKADD